MEFPTEIYWVTGLRQKGWLFAETRYLKLAHGEWMDY